MKKKYFIVASIICLVVIISSISVSKSYTQSIISDKLSKDAFENATERVEVKSIFDADFPIAQRIINQDPSFLPKEFRSNPEEYQPKSMGNPYKVYVLDKDFVQKYKISGQFGSSLSGKYLWEVPLLDSVGRVVSSSTAWNNNGKWEVCLTGLNISPDLIQLSADNELIAKLLISKDLMKFKELKHIRVNMMDGIYLVLESGEEYIIPMSKRPELTGLDNLKVYTADEAMEVIIKRIVSGVDENGAIITG